MSETISLATETSPVLKAVRVLAHLARQAGPVALADLSRALGLPKPTLYRLALVLERGGFIQKDPLTRRYAIGAAFEELALSVLRNGAGHVSRRLQMDRLSEKLGERVNLGVLAAGKVLYVQWVESTSPVRVEVKPGAQVPVHCSANGKLLMAFAPEPVCERFLGTAPFPAHTKNTLTSAPALARELERIRRQGYSEDDEEFLPGVCCLAVPVRDRQGHVVAGLAVMAPASRFPLDAARSHLPDLHACAQEISADLGWLPPKAPPHPLTADSDRRSTPNGDRSSTPEGDRSSTPNSDHPPTPNARRQR